MKCAVITPVGPGHRELSKECKKSVRAAIQYSSGPFHEVSMLNIDDTSGKLGRSAARNRAVRTAYNDNMDWLFFLDADDLLLPDAFELVRRYIDDYDAVWGTIVEIKPGSDKITIRNPQVFMINNFRELLMFDQYYTIQMGHFVRTNVAMENPFDETIDTGEDIDYYLRVWEKHRCIKIPETLFVNRRGRHSTGPKSASGRDWRKAVEIKIGEYRDRHGLHFNDQEVLEKMKEKVSEYLRYCEAKKS